MIITPHPGEITDASARSIESSTASTSQRTPASAERARTWAKDFVIGESPAIREAIVRVHEAGGSEARLVLVAGETGTGKELFARGVHACGAAVHEPFVQINCAALAGVMFERELFGCEPEVFADIAPKRGLLEIAARGTLLLDEIDTLSPLLQHKLLRVLDQGSFRRLGGREDVLLTTRIVASATVPLDHAVADGAFTAALYERLNAVRIDVPPLRERGDDVVLLARYFLHRIALDGATAPLRLSIEAANALREHPWPGNVRELRNVIERAVLVCSGDTVQRRHLMFQRRRVFPDGGEVETVIQIPASGKSLDAITRDAIRVTLVLTQGNLSATARILGISRPTLARKIRDLGLLQSSAITLS